MPLRMSGPRLLSSCSIKRFRSEKNSGFCNVPCCIYVRWCNDSNCSNVLLMLLRCVPNMTVLIPIAAEPSLKNDTISSWWRAMKSASSVLRCWSARFTSAAASINNASSRVHCMLFGSLNTIIDPALTSPRLGLSNLNLPITAGSRRVNKEASSSSRVVLLGTM
ncbi:hypothetical protein D3C85_849740 [compost metagenome]